MLIQFERCAFDVEFNSILEAKRIIQELELKRNLIISEPHIATLLQNIRQDVIVTPCQTN